MSKEKKSNGRSTPEDFLLPDYPEFDDVTLPSGLQVKLRPPISMEYWAHAGHLPGSLAEAGKPAGASGAEEIIEWSYRTLCALIAEPKFSREPKEGEFHPRRLQPQDRLFLVAYYNRYMHGGGGAGLESFRRANGKPAGARSREQALQRKAE